MTKVEILKRVMSSTPFNTLYHDYTVYYKKLIGLSSNEKDRYVTLISDNDFESVIDYLYEDHDNEKYYKQTYKDYPALKKLISEEDYKYYMEDLEIKKSTYKILEKETFQITAIDEDSYKFVLDVHEKLEGTWKFMPICFEQFYKFCEGIVNKNERKINKEVGKESLKTKNEADYRKIAEGFLENYELIINSYKSLFKIVDDEQLINIFEMIFKNFGE